jgi:hypothetical protein
MKTISMLDFRSFASNQFGLILSFETKPCYEKMPVKSSVDSFLNAKFIVTLPGVGKAVNAELNDAISHSINTHAQMGSWFNVELTSALGSILDTTKNAAQLAYKSLLLDSNNIVLVRSSSITDFSFFINTTKPMSAQLQAVLKQKPTAVAGQPNFRVQLFYLDEDNFEISISGIFQVMGQFMKCSLR